MPEHNTLVSVLLPVRDWRATTALAINSILAQSHGNLELLLIGQRDLQTLIDNLRASGIDDPRLRLVARKTSGIVSALNSGLAQARGTFIARMDDDDIAYPKRLAVQLAFLHDNPTVDLCACCIRFIDTNGTRDGVASGNRDYETWLNQLTEATPIANACFAENPMPHPTLLAHHTVWKQLKGYHDVDGPEDHDLILRAMLDGLRMGKPAQCLLDWREHKDRLTYTDARYRRQAFVAQSARALVQHPDTQLAKLTRAVWIAGTGKRARHWHDELQANGVPVQGFVDMYRPGPQRRKRLLPIITYDELQRLRSNELLVSAVTQPGGRSAVVDFFVQQGWREGHDFIIGG